MTSEILDCGKQPKVSELAMANLVSVPSPMERPILIAWPGVQVVGAEDLVKVEGVHFNSRYHFVRNVTWSQGLCFFLPRLWGGHCHWQVVNLLCGVLQVTLCAWPCGCPLQPEGLSLFFRIFRCSWRHCGSYARVRRARPLPEHSNFTFVELLRISKNSSPHLVIDHMSEAPTK